MSVLTWVVFITILVSPHHALCMLSIKVSFLLRKEHFSKNCQQTLPTGTAGVMPSRCGALPFPAKALDPCCIPTSVQSSPNRHCGLTAAAVSLLLKCYLIRQTHLTYFKPDSFPSPALSSSVDKSTVYQLFFYIWSLSTSRHILRPGCLLLLFLLTTSTMTCPCAVTQSAAESGYWNQHPCLPGLLDPEGAHWTTLP